MIRVCVCGGRDYGLVPRGSDITREVRNRVARERWNFNETMDTLLFDRGVSAVIHGGMTGADTMADVWARRKGIPIKAFPANWRALGKSAGPIRNQQMIDEGEIDVLVAFPGGKGTADMVARARAAGLEVIEA